MEDNLVYSKNAVVRVTKEFTFEAGHYLKEYDGECANIHGHSYRLQVTARGHLNDIGMVVDFKNLKSIVQKEVVDLFDHKCLNIAVKFNSTAENLVVYIFEILEKYFISNEMEAKIESVKLWETATSFAEYRGESHL